MKILKQTKLITTNYNKWCNKNYIKILSKIKQINITPWFADLTLTLTVDVDFDFLITLTSIDFDCCCWLWLLLNLTFWSL